MDAWTFDNFEMPVRDAAREMDMKIEAAPGRRLKRSAHYSVTRAFLRRERRGHATRRGFSLLEMMLVVVIIGLLAGVVVFQFAGQGERARISTTKTKMQSVKQAIDSYIIDTGTVPSTLETLMTGTTPYLATMPKDAWRQEFVYYPESEFLGKQYTLLSIGKDGQEGTEDDIDLWIVEEEEG